MVLLIFVMSERTATTVCGACGSETADHNLMKVNKYVKQLEQMLIDTFEEYNSTGHLSTKLCIKSGLLLSEHDS